MEESREEELRGEAHHVVSLWVKTRNNDPHPKVKPIIESIKGKGAETRTMIQAAGKRGHELKNWPRRKEGDPVYCHEWVLGGCHQEGCTLVHDNSKTSVELVDWLCHEVQPGIDKIKLNVPNWIPPPVKNKNKLHTKCTH